MVQFYHMSGFRQNHRLLHLWMFRLLTGGMAVVAIVLAQGVWGVYQKERETRHNRSQIETQLAALKSRDAELREEIAYLQTDRGVEAELRRQFEVGREGEKLLLIVDRPIAEEPATAAEEGWWERLWPW